MTIKALHTGVCVLALLSCSAVHAETAGKPDKVICGFDITTSHLKDVKAKLGKPTKYGGKGELSKVYIWMKEKLRISVHVSVEDDSVMIVTLKGVDPNKICKSERGMYLGQTLDEVKAIYGNIEEHINDDGTIASGLDWQASANMGIGLHFTKEKRLDQIEAKYMLE